MSPKPPMSHAPIEQTLFRLRVRYRKRGRLAYLGHLEVVHTIERSIRRAGLPYAVSQGFSPHMRVGFSSALPVGTSSSCEWYDVFLTELVPAGEALSRLQAATAADLHPDRAGYVDVRALALTAAITRVGYRVELDTDAVLDGAMERVVALGGIPYARGKKRKQLDVNKLLVAYGLEPRDGGAVLTLDTRCDNEGSLRPEILLAALDRVLTGSDEAIVSTGIQDLAVIHRYRVERVGQYVECEDGSLVEPLPFST